MFWMSNSDFDFLCFQLFYDVFFPSKYIYIFIRIHVHFSVFIFLFNLNVNFICFSFNFSVFLI